MKRETTYLELVSNVENAHNLTSSYAKGAVNQLLTVRNWIIGYYIVEFEQHGKDRAKYGTRLLENLAKSIDIKGLDRQMLGSCRMFYQRYPQICETVSRKLIGIGAFDFIPAIDQQTVFIDKLDSEKCETVSRKFEMPAEMLLGKLSFSHIKEIMSIDDSFERFFYELECIKGTWSVRELRRQISTNLYVRAGISKNPELLLEKLAGNDIEAAVSIKDPFTFEFLGLEAKAAVTESDLEQALMDHLQEFLLELGKGFCFEARQKRIIIDGNYYFPDLVLYNRILHCNVIIELKNEEFSHENLGQLNAYVAYYKENEMHEGDNPPVGILLCTKKGQKMVEYALSGMDNTLFVSTYMLQLPDRTQLEQFLLNEMKEIGI